MTESTKENSSAVTAVFVYGTLMRGKPNHHLVSSATKVLPATARGQLYSLIYGYPVMIDSGQDGGDDGDNSDELVHGELYFFDDIEAVLPGLDHLEGYRPAFPDTSLYLRRIVDVTTDDGQIYPAYTYLAGPNLTQRLEQIGQKCPDGRWH